MVALKALIPTSLKIALESSVNVPRPRWSVLPRLCKRVMRMQLRQECHESHQPSTCSAKRKRTRHSFGISPEYYGAARDAAPLEAHGTEGDKGQMGGARNPIQHMELGTTRPVGSNTRPAALTRLLPIGREQPLTSLNTPKSSTRAEQTGATQQMRRSSLLSPCDVYPHAETPGAFSALPCFLDPSS